MRVFLDLYNQKQTSKSVSRRLMSATATENRDSSPNFQTPSIFQLQNPLIKAEASGLREESCNATVNLHHNNYLTPPKSFLRATKERGILRSFKAFGYRI